MPTQRSATTRRGLLAAAGGCLATGGCVALAGRGFGGGAEPVTVLAAGSLQHALSERLGEAVDVPVEVETRGSVGAARFVAEGLRDPDVLALADTDLYSSVLDADWYARAATNALTVAYDRESPGGRRVGRGDRWFDPVLAGEATLGRTDPDLDPLGYRALFMLELASEYYDRPGLRGDLTRRDQIYPETSLLSRFETGDLDAAVVYRNMAVERDYAARDLPPALDLSDPDRADAYAAASYTLSDGETVRGDQIAYGVQARTERAATREVFTALVDGTVLGEGGFVVPESFPEFEGTVPTAYRDVDG